MIVIRRHSKVSLPDSMKHKFTFKFTRLTMLDNTRVDDTYLYKPP